MGVDKARILEEIRRTAAENGGVTLGRERFSAATGIPLGSWRGKYWRNWSEAVEEAGLAANQASEAHDTGVVVQHLALLTLKNKRFPTYADLRMEKRSDPSFPAHHAFHRLGPLEARAQMVRRYVEQHPEHHEVLEYLPATDENAVAVEDSEKLVDGSVYMLKLGKHYKIGKTFSVPRRHREIALELPEKPDVVRVITTDDPTGIETYWHSRFAAKRTNGEWFALAREDVQAFRRRKFM